MFLFLLFILFIGNFHEELKFKFTFLNESALQIFGHDYENNFEMIKNEKSILQLKLWSKIKAEDQAVLMMKNIRSKL